MRASEPLTSSLSFLALLAECERSGIDPAEVIAVSGLNELVLGDREAQLPLRCLVELIKEIERRCGDPAFAIRAAENLPIGAYGVVDFIVCNAPTFRASLRQLVRYFRLLTQALTLKYEESAELAWITAVVPTRYARVEQFLVDFTLGCIVTRSRRYYPGVLAVNEACFRYPKPTTIGVHERVFGGALSFGSSCNGLAFPRDVVVHPLAGACAPLADILEPLGQQMLARLPEPGPLSLRVRQAVKDSFVQQTIPGIGVVAERLHMSRRSLQRQLAAEGVTFQALYDQVRKELAVGWLGEPSMSISDVAFLLGFSMPSAFHRAFKRWTGKTPQSVKCCTSRPTSMGGTPGFDSSSDKRLLT